MPAPVDSMREPLFRLVCTSCREALGEGFVSVCPSCGGMADVEYALRAVELRDSKNPYRRFADLLPVGNPRLLPDEAEFTPTIHAVELGDALGIPWLFLKNETVLPTGTTKDRMAAVALAYLWERGVRCFSTSSTGNSSTALARGIARIPGLVMHVFTGSDFVRRVYATPSRQVVHWVLRGATFVEAFDAAGEFARRSGCVSERGFFNPGRREGLKLAWLEAAEQVPRPIDWYVQAVASAMGVYGTFKAARELHALGRIDRVPRLVCVQQESCAPMAAAWRDGSDHIRPKDIVHRPIGIAAAILRGDPSRAYPHVRSIVSESRGTFVVVSESEMRETRRLVEDLEGLSPCFSAAAAVAGVAKLRRTGAVAPEETVLVNLTGRDRERDESPPAGVRWLRRDGSGWLAEDGDGERTAAGPP